jgi:tRNA(Glu) U13 pseudouridine synthase TruD
MTNYAMHHYMTEAEREQRRQQIEFDETLKDMENQLATLIVNLQILRRNGPSKDLLQRIDLAGNEFTIRLKAIMDSAMSSPPRLTSKGR